MKDGYPSVHRQRQAFLEGGWDALKEIQEPPHKYTAPERFKMGWQDWTIVAITIAISVWAYVNLGRCDGEMVRRLDYSVCVSPEP